MRRAGYLKGTARLFPKMPQVSKKEKDRLWGLMLDGCRCDCHVMPRPKGFVDPHPGTKCPCRKKTS